MNLHMSCTCGAEWHGDFSDDVDREVMLCWLDEHSGDGHAAAMVDEWCVEERKKMIERRKEPRVRTLRELEDLLDHEENRRRPQPAGPINLFTRLGVIAGLVLLIVTLILFLQEVLR